MSNSFDPYHKWLGIPPNEQPPNHYRLLGVKWFESDLDVIRNAADQRMIYLKSFSVGPDSQLSQKLLDEIAAAKVCLLQPELKDEYDKELRNRQTPPPKPQSAKPTSVTIDVSKDLPSIRKRHGRVVDAKGTEPSTSRFRMVMLVAFPILLLGTLSAIWFGHRNQDDAQVSNGETHQTPPLTDSLIRFEWSGIGGKQPQIKVDDKLVSLGIRGKRPLRCTAGEHRIQATCSGYKPQLKVVQVPESGELTVTFSFEPLSIIQVNLPKTLRDQAEISLNGQQVDSSSAHKESSGQLEIASVPGEHVIRIVRTGFHPWEERLTVELDQIKVVNPLLKSSEPPLVQELEAAPEDAPQVPADASPPPKVTRDVAKGKATTQVEPGPKIVDAVSTSIFGVTGKGKSFVYVFDRSGSMDGFGGSPLYAWKRALLASLSDLSDGHEFQLVLYNEKPLRFGSGKPSLVSASKQAKERAKRFINNVSAIGATRHLDAILLALRLQPDVIFVLTDSDEPVLTDPELQKIRSENQGAVIHAVEFGFGPMRRKDSFLRRLSDQNGGEFDYVDIAHFE